MANHVNPVSNDSSTTSETLFEAYTVFPAVEAPLEEYLGAKSKLQMPQRYRENWVRYLPWCAVVFLPFTFVTILLLVGVTAWAASLGYASYAGAIVGVAVFVLNLLALPGLFSRTRRGWALFVYALSLSALSNIINFSLFGLLVSVALFWIAFQVKYLYK